MKSLKILILILVLASVRNISSAQKCYRPEPMTLEQISIVKGIWKGSYQHEGKEIPITVTLYTNNIITCKIDTPPVKGNETSEQIRFCGGGEFHFKKYVGEMSYEFQGTPKDGMIKGILTIRRNDVKVGHNGTFEIKKIQS